MSQCKYFLLITTILISFYGNAKNDAPIQDCSANKDDCNVVLTHSNVSDESNYDVKIVSSKTGKEVFPGVETNTTMESISLQLVNGKYVFSKKSTASGRSVESVSFYFNNETPENVFYISIDSAVNSSKRILEWGGSACKISKELNIISGVPSILSSFYNQCNFSQPREYGVAKHGDDIEFKIYDSDSISSFEVIALDSAESTSVDLLNIGCVKRCAITRGPVQYVGKLNGSIRISLYLDKDMGEVSGYYYYQSQLKKILLRGNILNGQLLLKTESGEVFSGTLKGNILSGFWNDQKGTKKYPFSLYQSLI